MNVISPPLPEVRLAPMVAFKDIALVYERNIPDMGKVPPDLKKQYRLFSASCGPDTAQVLLMDRFELVVAGRTDYPIRRCHVDLEAALPEEHACYERFAKSRGWRPNGMDDYDDDMMAFLDSRTFELVFRLQDLPADLDWGEFVKYLLSFGGRMDARLKKVLMTLLLRGFGTKYSPSAFIATNLGTRMERFLSVMNSSPKAGGTVARNGRSQLSSAAPSGFEKVMEMLHLASLMGEKRFQVGGPDPMAVVLDPTQYPETWGLYKLVDGLEDWIPALGAQFGIFAYGWDFDTFTKKRQDDTAEWERCFDFYRAVEERAARIIRRDIYEDPEVVEWLERPVDGYDARLLRTFSITDSRLVSLWTGHFSEGWRHLKGGALAFALVANTDMLFQAARTYAISPDLKREILQEAEGVLKDLVSINRGSLSNMSVLLQKNEKMEQEIFDSMPVSLQEVVLGVKAFKEKTSEVPITMPLKALEAFLPRTKFPDIEKLESVLMDKHQIYRALLKNHFGFHIQSAGNELMITFTDSKMNITVHA